MKITYEHMLPYPRQRVFDALLDPAILSRVLPGVERFEVKADDEFDVTLKLGVPAVKGMYKGSIRIASKVVPSRYELEGGGKGSQGWVKGKAVVVIEEAPEGARVLAAADAQIGGRIAGVGQRMMQGVARSMAREVFESLDRELAGQPTVTSRSPVAFLFRAVLGWLKSLFGRSPKPEAARSAGASGKG